MSLSKKSKLYILLILSLVAGVIFALFQTSSTTYTRDAVVATAVKTDIVETKKVVEKTSATAPIDTYKVDKNFNLIPTDPAGNTKVVLLTIDDGPTKQSIAILKILDDHKVKAIFFINGANDRNYKDTIKKEFDAGHAIGNHTWSHKNLKQIKNDVATKEIDSTTKLIADITGANPQFFRSPFGISSDFSREHVKKENMISMNWSGSTKDWEKSARDKKVFVNNVMKDLHPGMIILMHEHQWDTDALEDLIIAIKEKGYTFVDPKNITN